MFLFSHCISYLMDVLYWNTCVKKKDMRFVNKFTPPDFQTKNFTPLISHNSNIFGDKNTKKMSENGEIYTAGKNFTLPPALTHGQIPPLAPMLQAGFMIFFPIHCNLCPTRVSPALPSSWSLWSTELWVFAPPHEKPLSVFVGICISSRKRPQNQGKIPQFSQRGAGKQIILGSNSPESTKKVRE